MADGDTDASFRCVASRRTPAFVVEGTECTAFVSSVNVHRDVAAGWCRAWPSSRVESGRASPSCFDSIRKVPRDLVGPARTLRGFDSRRLHCSSRLQGFRAWARGMVHDSSSPVTRRIVSVRRSMSQSTYASTVVWIEEWPRSLLSRTRCPDYTEAKPSHRWRLC
jgi:hypothetical protein